MNRVTFQQVLTDTVAKINDLFKRKNKSYGKEDDVFYNFKTTADRVVKAQHDNEYEGMFRVLACYVDKHWVALCHRGLSDPDFRERCLDIITYMFIALAIHKEAGNNAK